MKDINVIKKQLRESIEITKRTYNPNSRYKTFIQLELGEAETIMEYLNLIEEK